MTIHNRRAADADHADSLRREARMGAIALELRTPDEHLAAIAAENDRADALEAQAYEAKSLRAVLEQRDALLTSLRIQFRTKTSGIILADGRVLDLNHVDLDSFLRDLANNLAQGLL